MRIMVGETVNVRKRETTMVIPGWAVVAKKMRWGVVIWKEKKIPKMKATEPRR